MVDTTPTVLHNEVKNDSHWLTDKIDWRSPKGREMHRGHSLLHDRGVRQQRDV